jgi:cytochrome bd-type quinol oxidase subunit 2
MKKVVALLLVVILGIACCPDPTSLKTAAFAVAVVLIITGLIIVTIGIKDGWGILPEVNFSRTINRALSTPESSAEVVKGFLVFLGLILIAIFKAL